MNQAKLSSKVKQIVKSAAVAAVVPIVFIYIMIAKPDYYLMNGLAHIVLPVANVAGDIITWPVRVIGNTAHNIHDVGHLRSENEELRARLAQALSDKDTCDIAISENKKLNQELGIIKSKPSGAILADVIMDNTAFGRNTFFINRGARDGIEPNMAVVTTDNTLVGIVIDAGIGFARVRALTDANSNIAVHVVGTEVYGFLRGRGTSTPKMEFFNDPKFQATKGIKLITSNISGTLPRGIVVGDMINDTDVRVRTPSQVSRVIVLKFDKIGERGEYK